MNSRDFALQEAPTSNADTSASPYALPHGASSGACPCLKARTRTTSKAESRATSKAFDPRQDAPFAAVPRPLGRGKVLAARAALLPGISPAPFALRAWAPPSGGFAGYARSSRTECGIGPGRATSNILGCYRNRVRLPALEARRQRGCPSAVNRALRGLGFAPHCAFGSLGCLACDDALCAVASPLAAPPDLATAPLIARGAGSLALAPASPVPNGTRHVGRAQAQNSGSHQVSFFLRSEA